MREPIRKQLQGVMLAAKPDECDSSGFFLNDYRRLAVYGGFRGQNQGGNPMKPDETRRTGLFASKIKRLIQKKNPLEPLKTFFNYTFHVNSRGWRIMNLRNADVGAPTGFFSSGFSAPALVTIRRATLLLALATVALCAACSTHSAPTCPAGYLLARNGIGGEWICLPRKVLGYPVAIPAAMREVGR